jgi:hypothetical protein
MIAVKQFPLSMQRGRPFIVVDGIITYFSSAAARTSRPGRRDEQLVILRVLEGIP